MRLLTGLTCPDGFVSQQYVAGAVDTTGMEFIASYDDGTDAPVSPQSLSPTTWGDEAGTQTCTFSYTEGEITETCEVEAVITYRGHAGYPQVSGSVTNEQTQWTAADLTGITISWEITDLETHEQIGTLTKTWTEIEAWNTEHPDDPIAYIDANQNYDGVYLLAGNVNLTIRNGSGLGKLGYWWSPQGTNARNIPVTATLTGLAFSGSWNNSSQDVNARRNYAGLTLTKSYSNHADVSVELTGQGNPDGYTQFGGEIIELSPGTPTRRQAIGWTAEYTNEQPTFWFRRVDGKQYNRQEVETENVAVAPAITTAVNSSSLVTTKNLVIDPTIAGDIYQEQITEEDGLIPNIFDGTQSYNNCDFFIDLEEEAPIEVSEGDVFWYVMTKTDYDNDETLAVPAQGLDAMVAGLGPVVGEDGINLWSGLTTRYGGLTDTGVEFSCELTGEGTYTDENIVFVTAWAPAGATDVNVATLKPSDLTEIAKFNVRIKAGGVTRTLDHLTITGDFTNEQIRGTAPDLTGLTIKAVYDDESEETLTSDDYSISPATWPLGNPDNLGQARVTVSYTEDGVTKTAYKQPTLHYSTAAQELQVGQYGHIYYDFTSDDFQRTWKAANSILQNGVSQGDWLEVELPDSYYQDGTTYGPAALQADIAQYGVVQNSSGTINTDGYIPEWGFYTDHQNLDESYHGVSIGPLDPQVTPPATDNIVHILIGQAANSIAPGTGWKLSDLDPNGLRHYVVTLKAPSLP